MESQPIDELIEQQDPDLLTRHTFLAMFDQLTFREKWRRVFVGLRMPPESGLHKFAKLQILRLLSVVSAVVVPLLLFGLIVLFAGVASPPERSMRVEVIEPESQPDLEPLPPPDVEPPEPPDPMDFDVTTEPTLAPSEVVTPPLDHSPQPVEFDSVAMTRSPVIMRGMLGSRAPGARGEAIERFGGKWGDPAEAAVIRALEWLKANQQEDGSWVGEGSARSRAAMTGLALLTFLAYGQTPASERYGETVQKAIEYLISIQREDGSFRQTEGGFRGGVYAHGIASYALAEAFALTRIPMIQTPMVQAVQHIIDGQRHDGGFDYRFVRDGGQRDRCTSVAGWMAQALKAASLAGAEISELAEAKRKAAEGFKLQAHRSGHFIYASNTGSTRASMTPIGTLCLQLLGHSRSPEAQGGLAAIAEWVPSWDDPDMRHGILEPVYVWYYATQVYFHEGGSTWERWNDLFAPMLIENQNEDGSWTFDHGRSARYGPVYHTTLSALMLTVYYRYLPTFQELAADDVKPDLVDDQDIEIEFL